MPLDRIPFILENSLDLLFKQNPLSSWQIRSGDQYTQVTMRFSNTAILSTEEEVVYRKAPPSQLARDRKRAANRFQNSANQINDSDNDHFDEENISVVTGQLENRSQTLPSNMDNSGLAVLDQPVSQGVNTASISQPNQLTEASAVHPVSEVRVGDNAKSGNGDNRMSSVIEHYEIMSRQSDHSEEDEDDDGVITCDGCGGMMTDKMGSTWYRCNECDEGDFCLECYTKDVHGHHKRQLSKFECPLNLDLPHCSACGHYIPMDGTDAFLYKCKMCEDYCLCRKCKNRFLHTRHSKHLKLCSTSQFMSEIG